MPNFLTTISSSTVGIIIGVVVLLGVGGYLYWAWSEKKWPFGQ